MTANFKDENCQLLPKPREAPGKIFEMAGVEEL